MRYAGQIKCNRSRIHFHYVQIALQIKSIEIRFTSRPFSLYGRRFDDAIDKPYVRHKVNELWNTIAINTFIIGEIEFPNRFGHVFVFLTNTKKLIAHHTRVLFHFLPLLWYRNCIAKIFVAIAVWSVRQKGPTRMNWECQVMKVRTFPVCRGTFINFI